jgi:hypothetical protein
MEKITQKGITICQRAYEIIQEKKKDNTYLKSADDYNWIHAFLYDEFIECYLAFNKYLAEIGVRGSKDEPLDGEKFLPYVALWGKPSDSTKVFRSINRNGAITQSRTTMIKNEQGKLLSMSDEVRRLGLSICRKGGDL